MSSLWTEVVHQRRQVEWLKARIKTLTEQSSVEVDNALHLLELERSERGEQHQSVATNILMLMVCGFFSDLQFPYVQFPCTSLSADIIFALVWATIKRLEIYGFKVLACTADGASCNWNSLRYTIPEHNYHTRHRIYLVMTRGQCFSFRTHHISLRQYEMAGQIPLPIRTRGKWR